MQTWLRGMSVLCFCLCRDQRPAAEQFQIEALDQFSRSGTSWLMATGVQDTYRFSGHSISDPGTTYRTRDTVQGMRRSRDPIEHVRHLLTEHGLVDGKELKQVSLCEQCCC